jgi:hypothetical protein
MCITLADLPSDLVTGSWALIFLYAGYKVASRLIYRDYARMHSRSILVEPNSISDSDVMPEEEEEEIKNE